MKKENKIVKYTFITLTLFILLVLLVLPVVNIFYSAFSKGIGEYISSILNTYSLSAIKLTAFIVLIVLPLNIIFGVTAAWAITKYYFKGKSLLVSLIDLPFAISPVIIGLMLVLTYGIDSPIGSFLDQYDIQIIFALPGIILATHFVTLPFVFREVVTVMEAKGNAEEEAAMSLGASLWTVFRKITLPKVKWGIYYGTILAVARSIGEFGAVSVVSGHIIGKTNTMPLQVETFYNEYDFTAAFALASVMCIFSIIVILLKSLFHTKITKE